MEICAFSDGSSYTNFVAKKSLYRDKSHFLKVCLAEFDYILEDLLTEEEWSSREQFADISVVYDNLYCRYYPKMPEEVAYLDLDSGYLFCEKKRGAFEVYVIDVKEFQKAIKSMFVNA